MLHIFESIAGFFFISSSDVLTTFRVLLVLLLGLLVIYFTFRLMYIVASAISVMKWTLNAPIDKELKGDQDVKLELSLIIDSFRVVTRKVKLEDGNQGYWKSISNWRYYSVDEDDWILGSNAFRPSITNNIDRIRNSK